MTSQQYTVWPMQEIVSCQHGPLILQWPHVLTAEDIDDIEQHFAIWLRKERRRLVTRGEQEAALAGAKG